MTTVIIILFALICIFIVGASWCCLKVGADADKYSIGEKRKITSKFWRLAKRLWQQSSCIQSANAKLSFPPETQTAILSPSSIR